jgi:Flp pilus assembly protein TadD
MAVVLTRRGRFREAEDHLTDALRVNPAHMSAHNNLGVALASQGQFASAQREFEEALRLNPENGEAYNNRALIFAACPDARFRDGPHAVKLARGACELARWKSPRFLNTLAAAYAEAGDFDSAVSWQSRAIGLLHDERVAADYRLRLGLYQSKKPYRETTSKRPSSEGDP